MHGWLADLNVCTRKGRSRSKNAVSAPFSPILTGRGREGLSQATAPISAQEIRGKKEGERGNGAIVTFSCFFFAGTADGTFSLRG